ncbi:MAG: discoidin domain-containing protein [Dysgonamonadaceae bacterium]|jgi:hypothetical protein|nr:discoidin domain-containing protein [Dysgonamonadaceae bacterium]
MKSFICIGLIIGGLFSCNRNSRLENALELAGKNRAEFEQVLSHYKSRPADSLKYKAACFLIENMQIHYYRQDNPRLYEIMDSLNRSGLDNDGIKNRFKEIRKAVPERRPQIFPDLKSLSSGFLIRHIDDSFDNWQKSPWKEAIGFDDFCEYILPYAANAAKRELWTSYYRDKYLPYLAAYLQNANPGEINIKDACNALNDSLIASGRLSIYLEPTVNDYPPLLADHIRFGHCDEYVARTIYILRSLGIPVCYDFSPVWQNYIFPHSWNSLLTEDGMSYPFMGFEHKTDEWMLFQYAPKIFRTTFGIQKESLAAQYPPNSLPGIFKQSNIRDVSSEYFQGTDIDVEIRKPAGVRSEIVYICVFNNRDWIAVHWAKPENDRAKFTCMRENVIYIPAFYTENKFIAAGDPVWIDSTGTVLSLKADYEQRQTLSLTRKYPVSSRLTDIFLPRMLNGRFLAANRADFGDETCLHQIRQLPKYTFNTVETERPESYRYIRYRSEAPNYPDIAELEAYMREEDGQYRKLTGTVIGTEGSAYDPLIFGKEKVFDGDWVSYFSHHGEGAWVGLDFGKKERIDRIRFLPRNDDNGIHEGDEYELLYWDDGQWNSLGRQTGTEEVYEDCPSNALFLLHNHTRGREERIFTYENGGQRFW